METNSFRRKHIVPKLNLNELAKQQNEGGLSSRATSALISARQTSEPSHPNPYSSKRPELWSPSLFKSRKHKTYEKYETEMHNQIWKREEELSKQVSALTIKLDEIRQSLSCGQLSFAEAGKLLSKIRRESRQTDTYDNKDSGDLIFSLDLVEKLWECLDSDGLSCSEFSNLLSEMLHKPKKEFDVLFQKMDADGDETLSWAEYVSYLSQQQGHLWDQQENQNVSYFKENLSCVYNCNTHIFKKVSVINRNEKEQKYAILTSDNTLQIRNANNLALESSLNFKQNCTNLCCLYPSDLAVSFMDRSINIYSRIFDKNNKKIEYDLQHSFFALAQPMCMDTFCDNHSLLIVGETYGDVGLYNYLNQNCIVRTNCHSNTEHNNEPCVVKQVKKVANIGIVSAGMDTKIVVLDPNKWCKIRTLQGHQRGVYSIAFSLSHRLLISAGYDRKICVWDPYITKPLGLLKGHISPVVDNGLLIVEQTNQIITASIDKKIRVWDVRTWKCLQTIRDTSIHSPINELSAIEYDPFQSCLISTVGNKFRKWYYDKPPKTNKNDCDQINKIELAPIIDIAYSNLFKQIISVHVDDTCILWDIKTGQNVFNFKMNLDKDSLTCIAIDIIGKRLLTASQNGIITMWNFNNGAVMKSYEKQTFEITKLIYLPRTLHCVVCCGYSNVINRCPSHTAPNECNFVLQNKAHKSDVRAMCISEEYLLTGSSDGMIVEWHIDSNVKSQIFHCTGSITAMCIIRNCANENWYLFVGVEEDKIHIFEKKKRKKDECFQFLLSMKCVFNETLLHIAINENKCNRLMIADCDTFKLFDIQKVYTTHDYILMKEWKPHEHGCITKLLYIPLFDLFCSSSDNGDLVVWNLNGISLGQFGQAIPWNLGTNNVSNIPMNISNESEKKIVKKQLRNENDLETTKKMEKMKSYFDDYDIYTPKSHVVTESIASALLANDGNESNQECKTNPSNPFEHNLDKLIGELMKSNKKRKKSCRKPSILSSSNAKPRTTRKNSKVNW